MAALAIDVVTLYVARSEAQRAADAAALAGAKAFATTGFTSGLLGAIDSGSVQSQVCASGLGSTAAGDLQAQGAAASNLVAGQPAAISAITCNFSNPENPQITVTVQRTGLPTFFARVWGRTGSSVSASATAEAFNASGSSLPVAFSSVKPWIIPNCDPGATITSWPCTGNFFIDSSYNVNTANAFMGSSFIFHSPKIPPPSPTGVYFALDMSGIQAAVCPATSQNPSGSCANVGQGSSYHDGYFDNIACANTNQVSCGQTLQVDANNLGTNKATWNTDAAEGTQCLIHTTGFSGVGGTCPDPEPDCFVPNPGAPVAINGGSMNPNAGLQSVANISRSDSIVTAPIFDGQHNPCSNYSISGECDSTPANVQVIGFLQLGIQSVSAAGDVTAVILNAVGCNPSATGTGVSGGGVSVIPVRLIQP
jgi:hypothetical protein